MRNDSKSLLGQHLRIMGLVDAPAGLDDAVEAARIASTPLPRLDLAAARSRRVADGANAHDAVAGGAGRTRLHLVRRTIWVAPTLALAAALLTFLLVRDDLLPHPLSDATIRAKGDSKVWVYWERGGTVSPWTPETRLANGDRVRVELLAGEDVLAWLAVVDRTGQLLGEPNAWQPLSLASGEQAAFPGSVKLVGQDDGETLEVWTCPRRGGPAGDDELRRKVESAFDDGTTRLTALSDACFSERIPLR